MTPAQTERILAVNFLAPVRLTQQLLLSRPVAHIVNVSSMYGLYATRRCSIYHTTKYGLVGLTDSLPAEYGRYGLGATSLCPGFVRTGLFDGMMTPREQGVNQPPRWISTTPEKVAKKAVRAVLRNRRLVLATPAAHLVTYGLRLFPGLLDRFNQLGSRKTFRLPIVEAPPTIRLYAPPNEYDSRAA